MRKYACVRVEKLLFHVPIQLDVIHNSNYDLISPSQSSSSTKQPPCNIDWLHVDVVGERGSRWIRWERFEKFLLLKNVSSHFNFFF